MISWVIGEGGFLGSALRLLLQGDSRCWSPKIKIDWTDSRSVRSTMRAAVDDFSAAVGDNEEWSIYWCAGAGQFGDPETTAWSEFEYVREFCEALSCCSQLKMNHGAIFFSSSAGGVYGGSLDSIVTERSAESPNSPYGRAKVASEDLLAALALRLGLTIAIGRISNVFGHGQDLDKNYGLISRLCLNTLLKRPTEIFVPLETVRNYIHIDDAALIIRNFTRRTLRSEHKQPAIKLVCSPHNLSVATIVQLVTSVTGRRPPFFLSTRSTSSLYRREIFIKSQDFREVEPKDFVTPLIGILDLKIYILNSIQQASAFEDQ